MAEVRYLVVKRCDGWKVVSGSAQFGPFTDRLRAIEAAIESLVVITAPAWPLSGMSRVQRDLLSHRAPCRGVIEGP